MRPRRRWARLNLSSRRRRCCRRVIIADQFGCLASWLTLQNAKPLSPNDELLINFSST